MVAIYKLRFRGICTSPSQARPAIPSLNRPEVILRNITRPYRNIRVTGDTKKKIPYRKTPMDSYSKLKTKIIKN